MEGASNPSEATASGGEARAPGAAEIKHRVETNGIDPSTSCLQRTLSIVRSLARDVDAGSLVTARSSCCRYSAGAQTSDLYSFLCARTNQPGG